MIVSDAAAKKRYVCFNGKLEPLPYSVSTFFTSPLMKGVIRSCWNDLFTAKNDLADESIHSFISRRFSPEMMETLFDPLVAGIYAGNPHNLSIRACFPILHQWERSHGSVLLGALFEKRKSLPIEPTPFIRDALAHPMFSLVNGLETLPKTLSNRLKDKILFSKTVRKLDLHPDSIHVTLANEEVIEADYVYSAVPAHVLAGMLGHAFHEAISLLRSIPFVSVAVVNLGFSDLVLPEQGFGYLIPSNQNEDVLGVVWDSCVFPQQNIRIKETRLTVMIGGSRTENLSNKSEQELLEMSLQAIRRHMGITTVPAAWHVEIVKQAIPQYLVGHTDKVASLKAVLSEQKGNLRIMGSSYGGVSVNDCIAEAKEMAMLLGSLNLFPV
jgi:oxygen-dependent protoporphyrinogen oxidase